MANDATITVRLPEETRRALDEAAARLQRSRAFIVKEALDRHLAEIGSLKHRIKQRTAEERREGLRQILEIQRNSAAHHKYQTAQEVIDFIRDIRGD